MAVILVVDDNRDERRMLETLIRHYTSHEVLTADGAAEAYRQAGEADAVILDVMMPGEDGVAVYRKLRGREDTARIPIIFMSAYPDSLREMLSPREYQDIEVLPKPVNPGKLANRLNSSLGVAAARKRLEAEKFSQPEQLTILLAAIGQTGDGITLTDKNGRWLFSNRSQLEMFGYSRENFERITIEHLYTPESFSRIKQEAEPTLPHEGRWEGELNAVRSDGVIFPILLSLTQVSDDSGKFLGIMGISKDISVLKKTFSDLKETQEALVRAERFSALGGMVEGIAHEFNNLLTNILGNTQLLIQGSSDPLAQKRLRSIERAAFAGAEAVKSLQIFTLHNPDVTPSTDIDLAELLGEVLNQTRPRWRDVAQRKGISIEVKENLQEGILVSGNREELQKAFTNIVFNSIDALERGGSIVFQSWESGGKAFARITDNGKGMSPEVLEKAFDPFFTTERPAKSGMGLSEAYGIITKYGGDIRLESSPGKGTTVTVGLPIRTAAAPAAGTEPAPSKKPAADAKHKGRVLLVEDDAGVLEVLSSALTRAGYRVTARTDPEQGLAEATAAPFDLVITDLGMHGLSGLELARRIRAITPAARIALVTGWKGSLDLKREELAVVDAVWGKPFDLEQLLAECRKLAEPGKP